MNAFPRRRRGIAAIVSLVLFGLLPGAFSPVVAEPNEGSTPTSQVDQRRIAGGGLHTCAVLDTGEVQCWGQNDNGQLGNDSVAATTVPKKVVGITTALGVTGGSTHTCALIHDGTVKCWGNNGSGQLGNGRTSPPDPPVLVPATVSGLSDATAVAAGGFHTCAVRSGGTVACWGHDGSGQLGDGGGLGTSYEPVTVQVDTDADPTVETLAPLTGATAVTSGEYHSCALIGATGQVKCWGHNGFGQLGNGITLPGTQSTTAVTVSGIPDDDPHAHDPHKAVAITAGQAHTCAILDDNTVRCWGQNFFGQLGNNSSGDGTDSSTPVKAKLDVDGEPLLTPGDLDDLTSAVAITAGQFHTCVRHVGGGVRCWGQNGRGQLGDGTTTDRKVAFPVGGLGVTRAVTAGGFHTCALIGNALKCWGYNFYGQLGAYEPRNLTPVTVTALAAATVATVGDGHACGLVTSTQVPPTDQPVCWGNNASGELGADLTPSPADTTIPVDVADITDAGAVGLDPPALADPISAGNQFACALPAGSSTPKCWGNNTNGALGNGTNTSSDEPVAVSGLTGATQVSAGGELDPVTNQETAHACARRSDGSVRCWGSNGYGQLGNESTLGSNVPVTVRSDHDDDHLNTPPPLLTAPIDLTGVTAVAVGGRHSCALMADETVRCWGRNFDGQLGDGTTTDRAFAVTVDTDPLEPDPDESDPKHFTALGGVKEITAGARHTCARKGDNTVWCWGRGTSGQLGHNSFAGSDVPVQVHNIGASLQPVQITAGDFHTCARVKEPNPPGSGHTFARCWGDNQFGQIGDGSTTNRPTPTAPSKLDEPEEGSNIEVVKSMSAGRKNTCAVLIETSVWCWGDNQFGQIGDGVGALSKTPVDTDNLASVGGNVIPAPQDDAVTIAPGDSPVITVLLNDTDPDPGDTLTVSAVADPPRGTASTDGTTVTYTPDGNFCTADPTSNTDSFDYSVTDGTATVPATITVTVTCPNTAPDAVDDSATTAEEAAATIDVLANDSDINGQSMTVSAASDPANGATVIESGKVTYTPDANFVGVDTFTYTASDGIADSAPATVTVTVTNVNDAPVANDDNATTDEDNAVTIDVVANDTDTDGPSLAVGSVADAPHGVTVATSPTQVRYTPDPGYCGTDGFAYVVSDGSATDSATVTVTVNCTNDGPNAVDDAATTSEDVAVTVNVLANDTDPEGDALTIQSVTDPAHGTAVNNGTDVTYTPDPDFCGADDFGYTVTDGTETDSALVVPVVVLCHNDTPVANDDSPTTTEDTSAAVQVLANDADVDGDELTVASITQPANGAAVLGSSNVVSYTPDADFCGSDTFTYTVADGSGGTDGATVTVTVTCVNDAPVVATVGSQSLPWGETLTLPLAASDVDAGDSATFSVTSGPSGTSVVGGSFEWTPSKLQVGTHTVVVRATDGNGAFDDESFTVTVGRRATALTYAGATSGQYSDPTGANATLLDFEGNPVGGVVVGFTIGTRSGAGMTDLTTGLATSTIVLDGPMGLGTVKITFAGNEAYLPSSASDAFTIDKELVTTTFAGRHLTTTSGTSAAVQLTADVAEEVDGSLGMGSATLQVTFTQVGGGVLCNAPVSGTSPGRGTATCTTSSLGLGSRAVVAKVSSAKFQGPVDVGAFAVAQAPSGTASGGGRVVDGAATDDFAFQAKPVRKSPPSGDAVHVRRVGGMAVVNSTSTLTALSSSCSGGKTKVCTTALDGSSAWRWQVDLADGTVTLLTGTSTLHIDASDATEPDGTGADRYGVAIGAPDSYSFASRVLAAGNVRIVP